ncbi:MAG: formate dehydrogenase [Pseudolabrys sp.]
MKPQGNDKLARRDFLRVMGLSVGAGAGLAIAAAGPLAGEAPAAESEAEAKKKRYNPNAPDVKDYYRVNRY